jgi:hypothetical protein
MISKRDVFAIVIAAAIYAAVSVVVSDWLTRRITR